jgi:[ribosomal protein S5]-alanine N-acetyltransferase
VATYPPLETKRLILRPIELADAPAIQRFFPRWEIVQYLDTWVPWPYPDDGAERYLKDFLLPTIDKGRWWSWSIRLKTAPDQLIGVIDLFDWTDDNRAFWLDPAFQGQGLITEAADAVTDYWFDVLKRPVLRAPKAVANAASIRISEKQGMRLIKTGDKEYRGGMMPSQLWEITAEEWRQRRR